MIDSPAPQLIKNMRKMLGLTQREAAESVHVTVRAWQHWEEGKRHMPPAAWELALIKAGLHPDFVQRQADKK